MDASKASQSTWTSSAASVPARNEDDCVAAFKLIFCSESLTGPDVAHERSPAVSVLVPAPTRFLVQDLDAQRDPRRGRREPPRQAHERRCVFADVAPERRREFAHELVQRGLDVLLRRELSVVLVAVAVFAGRRRDEELGGRELAEHQVLFLLAIQPRLNL